LGALRLGALRLGLLWLGPLWLGALRSGRGALWLGALRWGLPSPCRERAQGLSGSPPARVRGGACGGRCAGRPGEQSRVTGTRATLSLPWLRPGWRALGPSGGPLEALGPPGASGAGRSGADLWWERLPSPGGLPPGPGGPPLRVLPWSRLLRDSDGSGVLRSPAEGRLVPEGRTLEAGRGLRPGGLSVVGA
jgi:hypothetical protein